ncbi:hypothetical protein JCM11251_007799 [Rhodosporidiobolus azoricus]
MGIDAEQFVGIVPSYLICSSALSLSSSLTSVLVDASPLSRLVIKSASTSSTMRRSARPAAIPAIKSGQHSPFAALWMVSKPAATIVQRGCKFAARGCADSRCKFRGTANELANHLRQDCQYRKVECPRGCGATYPLFRSSNHGDKCAHWLCQAVEGCPTRSTLVHLEDHEDFCLRMWTARETASKQLEAEVAKRKEAEKEVSRLKAARLPYSSSSAAKSVAAAEPANATPGEGEDVNGVKEEAAGAAPPPKGGVASGEGDGSLNKRVSKPSARAPEATAKGSKATPSTSKGMKTPPRLFRYSR